MLQIDPGLLRLADGLLRPDTTAIASTEQVDEGLATFESLPRGEGILWILFALVLAGSVAWGVVGVRIVRDWKRNRRVGGAKWSQLAAFLQSGKNRAAAISELEQIEILSSLMLPQANNANGDWFQLTPSEKQVARGIFNDVPAQELAESLLCTPSHVYNLRSSIRKKWGIKSNQALRQAISERMPSED